MTNIFTILLFAAMLAVLISLCLGLFAMVKGGEFNKKHSNTFMRIRIGLQITALLLFVLAIMSR